MVLNVQQLWAPWRLEYITGDKPEGCALCAKQYVGSDRDALILARSEYSLVMMNLYPYNNGHLMIIPERHVADLTDLNVDERQDLNELQVVALNALRMSMDPDGFNLGVNLGEAAGAGIAGHLHLHVVPRWTGDTNFMPLVAETTVMPQHLKTTYDKLLDAFRKIAEYRTASGVEFAPATPSPHDTPTDPPIDTSTDTPSDTPTDTGQA